MFAQLGPRKDWLCEQGRFGLKTPDPKIKAGQMEAGGGGSGAKSAASEASVCGLEGDYRQANGRGVFIHRGRSKEVGHWPSKARNSGSSWTQVDPEVVAKLDEVRKAKGMTPRAVSDEDGFEAQVLLTSLRPLQLPVPWRKHGAHLQQMTGMQPMLSRRFARGSSSP